MSVAKSYEKCEILRGPYEKNKRFYVEVAYKCCSKKTCQKCGGSGFYPKEVRWYNDTIIFDAKTDRKSFINLTNHMYFNLNGGVKPIYNHQLYLRSHQCYSMNDDLTLIKLENAPDFLNFFSIYICTRTTSIFLLIFAFYK